MAVNPDLRNQHTTIDAKRAKNRRVAKCSRCGVDLMRPKKYCSPCYDDALMENIARNRSKYGKKKVAAAPETAKEETS